MPKKKSFEVSSNDYNLIKQNYIVSGKKINEQIIGSRKKLYNNKNILIATVVKQNILNIGNISQPQFFSFLGVFNKNLYKNFYDNQELFNLDINFIGTSRKKNINKFDNLKTGDFFYNLDLNSAYWQILYKLNYISLELYEKYKNQDDYKIVKRLCVSFLSRKNQKHYYFNENEFTISCDTSILKKVYINIRNFLYKIFNECAKTVDYIAFNIDSIYIDQKNLKKAKNFFKLHNLDFKLVLCQKINSLDYTFGKEKRKF